MNFINNHLENIKEIFYHEIGHFVAFKIHNKNRLDFEISEISIEKMVGTKNGFGGSITPIFPKSYKNSRILSDEKLSHYLIDKYFGCIFQSVLSSDYMDLRECMLAFGKVDQEMINGQTLCFGRLSKRGRIASFFDDFYIYIKGNMMEEFEIIRHLNFKGLLIESNEVINVNIPLLEDRLRSFIDNFEKVYLEFYIKLLEIIKE
ncbi:MAG: hypothetical protein PHQ74_12830 [Crocinitomicaceae bacterium]|nr:hypothetical protein [Crocinitomicaceae bacterium]